MRSALPALVLAAVSVSALTAQERPPPMERGDTIPQDTATRDTVRPPAPTLGYDPAAVALEVSFGLPGSGTAQRQPVRAWRTDFSGTVVDSALLTRATELRGGISGGVSGIIGLGKDWALRLGLQVATATVATDYTGAEADEVLVTAANATPGAATELRLLSLETGLRFRIPSSRRLQPYLEVGAALSRWAATGDVPPALDDDFGTRVEAVAGFGGVIPLTSRFSARIHASTRLFRTLVDTRPPGDTLGTRVSLGWPPGRKEEWRTTTLVAEAPTRSLFADGARETLGLLRLQAGLSYDLGRTLPPPPQPPEAPPDTTSPPGR